MSDGKIVYFAFFPFCQYYIIIVFGKISHWFVYAYEIVQCGTVWPGVVISQTQRRREYKPEVRRGKRSFVFIPDAICYSIQFILPVHYLRVQ